MNIKSGFVTIIGKPNVGKSTLLNAMLGEKIAAVSKKPQTTRTQIMGVVTGDDYQIIFLDTPGIHKAKNKLGEFMNEEIKSGISDADLMIYMVDCTKRNFDEDIEIIKGIKGGSIFLLINKTDLIEKEKLLPIIANLNSVREFKEIIPISAKNKNGVDTVLEVLKKYLPEGPKYFPDDTLTDQPEKQICSEFIREKLMRLLGDEIPYGTAVAIDEMKYNEEKEIYNISATIFCERESHKAIIIGKKGAMLKKIGTDARHELERFLREKVFLKLWVKPKENWRNSSAVLKNFGYKK